MEKDKKGDCRLIYLAHHPHFRCYHGQIGYRGRHQQLEQGLYSPKVACLPDAQLHQPSKTMFGYLAPLAVFYESLAMLQTPGLLQEGLLRM